MGGFGSGRKSDTNCTNDYRSIDIRRWQRDGLLVTGLSFNCQWSYRGKANGKIHVKTEHGQLRLAYAYRKNGGEWESLDYPVELQTTDCHYGGVRYWFICPTTDCGRRVALLYLDGKYFACRHCHQLAYRSQRQMIYDRKANRADKIRDKLEWEAGFLNGRGSKPKGMHWKTYYRLVRQHNKYVHESVSSLLAFTNQSHRFNE